MAGNIVKWWKHKILGGYKQFSGKSSYHKNIYQNYIIQCEHLYIHDFHLLEMHFYLEKERRRKKNIANHIFSFIIIVWMSRVQVYLWWHLTRLDSTWLGFTWNSNPINIKLFWFEHSPIYVKMSATFYNPKREENKSVQFTKGAFSTHTKKTQSFSLSLWPIAFIRICLKYANQQLHQQQQQQKEIIPLK